MIELLADDAKDDLLDRGYSRRQLGRIAAVFSLGAAAASMGRPAWASGGVPDPAPTAKVRIGANECWTGPLAPGAAAAAAIIPWGNRYSPQDQRGDFIKAVMQVEGVPYDHVAPWPGSSDPCPVRWSPSPRRPAAWSPPTRPSNWPGAPPSGSRIRSNACR